MRALLLLLFTTGIPLAVADHEQEHTYVVTGGGFGGGGPLIENGETYFLSDL